VVLDSDWEAELYGEEPRARSRGPVPPAVNHLGTHGRWAFAELTEAKVAGAFDAMIAAACASAVPVISA
jgi:hypothetical protein